MEITAYRLLYDNIHDFRTTAVHVESEIKRHGIRSGSYDDVPGMKGRTHHDMWVSMKTVSHFNLATSLKLMLKLLLLLNKITIPRSHLLTDLYDKIPEKFQKQLESAYQESNSVLPNGFELIAFINTASASPSTSGPPNRDISNLKGFFAYFDKDTILWQKRYSWELIEEGRWRHYISDISAFTEFIKRVMSGIQRY